MKNIFLFALAGALAVACGNGAKKGENGAEGENADGWSGETKKTNFCI